MSDPKPSLREFQAQLAERLQSAARGETLSKLGFLAGGRHWLTDLTEISEVVTVAEIVPVPWAKPWFLGLASVRGVIYGCTDLAGFLGLDQDTARGESRLLLAHPRFGINAALRVERTLGLRNPVEMTQAERPADAPSWEQALWRDAEGRVWTQLSVERLVATPQFLEAAIEGWGPAGSASPSPPVHSQPGPVPY